MIELSKVTASCVAGYPSLHPAIEVVGMDYNQNGVIDSDDLAMLIVSLGSAKGDPSYERRFDNNFDGLINDADKHIVEEQLGASITDIRAAVRTGEVEWITWPAAPPRHPNSFTGPLVALDRAMIDMFIGDSSHAGWQTVDMHPYETNYICDQFGLDMAIAAYKGLGWGHILYAESNSHAFNIFWMGGDWHNLNNWIVLEPQNRTTYIASRVYASMYQTRVIYLPIRGGPGNIIGVSLRVNYGAEEVSLGIFQQELASGNIEEPVPDIFLTEVPQ